MTEYYPEVLKLSDFRKTALGAEFLVDEDEEHRVQELEDKKARGKGAPTKAKQKGQSVALSGVPHAHTHVICRRVSSCESQTVIVTQLTCLIPHMSFTMFHLIALHFNLITPLRVVYNSYTLRRLFEYPHYYYHPKPTLFLTSSNTGRLLSLAFRAPSSAIFLKYASSPLSFSYSRLGPSNIATTASATSDLSLPCPVLA
jgi:hypothetical protein